MMQTDRLYQESAKCMKMRIIKFFILVLLRIIFLVSLDYLQKTSNRDYLGQSSGSSKICGRQPLKNLEGYKI